MDRTRLDGAVALISGAARGQGECEARLLVERGARVVLTDVLDELGEEVAASLGDSARYITLSSLLSPPCSLLRSSSIESGVLVDEALSY